MKKVLILQIDDRFDCHIVDIDPKLPKFDNVTLVASFDVSQIFLNVH